MDHRDHRSESKPLAETLTRILVVLATTVVAAHPHSRLSPEIVGSLLLAGGAVSGWLVDRRWALAFCSLWAILDWMTTPQPDAGEFAVRYGVMIGLMLWIARLKTRLRQEHQFARLDALTGLPNRQAFQDRCSAELSRAKRFRRPLTIALLDGDRFKAVNDQRGHPTGDRALQATARTLAETVRQYDFVARFGGDEFVIIFPETGPDDAERAVIRLQQRLQTQVGDPFSPLTFSLGVVTFFPGEWDCAQCLEEADRMLYQAKREGTGLARFASADADSARSV